MWKLDLLAFRGMCTSWNRGVRTILHLPFTTHTYMFNPLIKQTHMSLQLYVQALCSLSVWYETVS